MMTSKKTHKTRTKILKTNKQKVDMFSLTEIRADSS